MASANPFGPDQTPAALPRPRIPLAMQTPMSRSCEVCHQRKIRCDKISPCSNCRRGNNICRYPSTERRSRRPHKNTINDVSARVLQLERTLANLTKENGEKGSSPKSFRLVKNDSGVRDDDVENSPPGDLILENENPEIYTEGEGRASTEEILVEDGESSCYVNEVLLFRIMAEETELQTAMGTPKGTSPEDNATFLDIGTPFSDFRKSESADRVSLPSRSQSIQLWHVYLHNVDPLIRVLHIPTMEAAFYKSLNNPSGIKYDLRALLFSIYLAAITSLCSDDIVHLLNWQKEEALISYKRGLEQSLADCEFLDSPNMLSLQAMAIYLTCLRVYSPGRSTWTLYGLVMRSAQSIGLHRDGTKFKLSPFKTEMRRRLWWYLCAAETRAAEDHGISAPYAFGNPPDTRFPLNLDDSNLTPEMTHLPLAKPSWAGITFCMLIYEATVVLNNIYSSSLAKQNNGSAASTGSNIPGEFWAQLNRTYLPSCNPDIPIQHATILMGQLVSNKTDLIMQQKSLKLNPSSIQNYSVAIESLIDKACTMLETNIQLQTETLLRDFHWLLATYTQYYPLTYALWYLCVKPFGPDVDRTWTAVEKTIELSFYRGLPAKQGSKWMMIQALRRRALNVREAAKLKSTIDHAENVVVGLGGYSAEYSEELDGSVPDQSFWDLSATDFADWSALVDNSRGNEF